MWKYFWLTVKHRWFVLLAGLKTKAPLWRLLIHDWTKFLPSELPHYGRQFFGKADDPEGFAVCTPSHTRTRRWLKHQNRHPHHWEYWMTRPDNTSLPMPEWAVREMIADWMGASRAYEGKWPVKREWAWLDKHWEQLMSRFHPETGMRVIEILCDLNLAG